MMTEMNAVKNRTGNGVLRRGVALFAVLLLVSVLMAGAVSADKTATVSSFQELKDNLTNNEVTTIILANGFETSETINVNRAVTIDGNWNTITASSTFSSTYGHLMGISGNMAVILKNITLNSNSKAKGVQAYLQTGTATEIPFQNVVLLNSAGSGLTVNGAKITATNLTVKGSAWQSVDVGLGQNVVSTPVFTLDAASNLEDTYQISSDLTKNTVFGTVSPLPEGYKEYQLFAEDNSVYKIVRKYWSNKADFPATLANADGLNFNVSVTNKTGHVSVHTSLYQALTNYVDTGATVTVLKNFEHGYDYQSAAINRPTITKAVTLDLNGKIITANATDAAKTADTAFIKINGNGAALTVKNGEITLDGPYMFYAASESNLIIESGTFTATGTIASGNGLNSNTKMIISGGELTSTGAPVVFMPSTLTLIINGTAELSGPVGVDIKTGTVTINENAKITATGTGTGATAENGNGPVDGESSAIVLERTSAYKGDLVLTIGGDAQISSTSGAAIRNYIREKDLTYKDGSPTYSTPVITVQDNAKLSGAVTLENRKYTDGQTDAVVGTFNLNGGYYKFTGAGGVVLKDVTPTYPEGYAMSTEPVNDGYYAPVKATKPEVAESVTPKEDGTVAINPIPGGSLSVEGKTVTLTAAGTSGDDNSVILKITYDADATVSSNGASGNVASVLAEYKAISLENAPEVTTPTVDMTIELKTVDTNLPNITGKLGDAKQSAVQTFGGKYTTFKMGPAFVASHEKLTEFNINVSSITLTFLVPKSWAPLSGNIGVVHISDGSNPAATTNGIQVVVTDAGDSTNWKVTATSSKGFSGYATYYGVSSTPVPPVPPVYSSGDGNMENAFRVLFETQGGSSVTPATGLSYGDKITAPANPVRDGYTFGGWYKDAACTQAWSFSDAIDGDMTLYAKWTGGSAAQQTTTATAKPTTKATTAPAATTSQSQAAATTAAPAATTAAGVSPTLTQAPAPVFGALLGLLAAGVLLRRRE